MLNFGLNPKTEKVNIQQKLLLFSEHWSPKIVGELNGQHVKLVKFKGEFVWHKHDHEDEFFMWCREVSIWSTVTKPFLLMKKNF